MFANFKNTLNFEILMNVININEAKGIDYYYYFFLMFANFNKRS